MDVAAVVADEAVALGIGPDGIQAAEECGVEVRLATMKRLMLAHEAAELVSVHLDGFGLGLEQRHRRWNRIRPGRPPTAEAVSKFLLGVMRVNKHGAGGLGSPEFRGRRGGDSCFGKACKRTPVMWRQSG